MENIKEFIKRAAEKIGFIREKYIENNLPTQFSSIIAIPFFGDKKHEFILSSILLHRIKEYYGKYLILCGWPEHAGFFPAADEYWSVGEDVTKSMLSQSKQWINTDPKFDFYDKQLNRYFDTFTDFGKYYNNGLTSNFFNDFKFVIYNLPGQPAIKTDLLRNFSNKHGYKIFIYPVRKVQGWHRGKLDISNCRMEFWDKLLIRLLDRGYIPVVYTDDACYDLSPKYADRCIFIGQQRILDLFGIMRGCDCVLDVFSGISRWAIAARTPFIYLTERHIHIECKEFEIDDLCATQIPYKYIFSFTTMIEGVDYMNLVDTILAKLNNFVPEIDRNILPHTSELSVVAPYMLVRQRKAKMFGTKFFEIKKV